MKFFRRNSSPKERGAEVQGPIQDEIGKQINVLYSMYVGMIGAEKVMLRAGTYEALPYLHSVDPYQRLIGLQRMLFESTEFKKVPQGEALQEAMREIEAELSEMLARQAVEERLERQINECLDEKHLEYVRDLKLQLINEELGDVETPQTKEKLERLEKLDEIHLTKSVMELVRPKKLAEVVGQRTAIQSMVSKLATPYPQHILLYGPPGVGKTTVARLVLEEARRKGYTPFGEKAPFVETSGTTLRWDSRDMTNPLLGSVHDPIYQGAQRDLAETGVPEPKPGLVTQAHGGVLFIDEIGEMDPLLLNKLLKVLEDKRVQFESAYYDSSNPEVPAYIRKLFEEGAPADFILIGATTREPYEINPAIRSRCAEVYFSPLEESEVAQIVEQAAQSLQITLEAGVGALISEYTTEGRKAVNILADAYGMRLAEAEGGQVTSLTKADVRKVLRNNHLTTYSLNLSQAEPMVGKVNGLGVAGFMGSVLEIEAVAFPATEKGKGSLRFNDTAGSMAKDSVRNGAAVIRRLTGKDIQDYDIHVNVVGGGNIDGPSAGAAIVTAVLSALEGRPIRQDTAITGEISLLGQIKPVGGVFTKAYGAKRAKATHMLVPQDNIDELEPKQFGLQIHGVRTIEEVLSFMLLPQ